jgi:AraC-like DNA-binding protein
MGKMLVPLEKWTALRTSSVKAAETALMSVYGARTFTARKSDRRFFAHANYKELNEISFSYCSYSSPVTIDFPEASYYRQAFWLGGVGKFSVGHREIPISLGKADVVPTEVTTTADFGAEFRQLILRVDENALIRKLSALIGVLPNKKIDFSFGTNVENHSLGALYRLVTYVVNELDNSQDPLPALVMAELEQAVLINFLLVNPHNFSGLLRQDAKTIAPWQVRRAEEYIEANWQDPVTIESIAEAVGASARSIFLSFRQARGYSPMGFVKTTRLRHARQRLLGAGPNTTVTGVALECGFQNMGHFAMNYRKLFGETPSDTLNKAKGRMIAPRA